MKSGKLIKAYTYVANRRQHIEPLIGSQKISGYVTVTTAPRPTNKKRKEKT